MDKPIKAKAVVEVKLTEEELNSPNVVRKIHQKTPRKFMVSSLLDVALPEDSDTAYCTVELNPAPMISLEEIKLYAQQFGDKKQLRTFISWLEGLEKQYKDNNE
jgi:hypothetical protein